MERNKSLNKVLLTLWIRTHLNEEGYLTPLELSQLSGVRYDYIRARLTRWVSNGLLERHLYLLSIGPQGREMVKLWKRSYYNRVFAFVVGISRRLAKEAQEAAKRKEAYDLWYYSQQAQLRRLSEVKGTISTGSQSLVAGHRGP